jgi:hypothetical protein
MGGIKDWWDKLMGRGPAPEQDAGVSKHDDAIDANEYNEMKADSYVEQRDPGLTHMGDGER